jgi:hypothetical protein
MRALRRVEVCWNLRAKFENASGMHEGIQVSSGLVCELRQVIRIQTQVIRIQTQVIRIQTQVIRIQTQVIRIQTRPQLEYVVLCTCTVPSRNP